MWVLLIVAVIAVLWVIAAYNGLISLKNQTVNAFKQIDVQLKRRHDLIPNLVNAVKGAMDFERSTLEAVIQARNQAVKVNASGPEGIKQISQAVRARPERPRGIPSAPFSGKCSGVGNEVPRTWAQRRSRTSPVWSCMSLVIAASVAPSICRSLMASS